MTCDRSTAALSSPVFSQTGASATFLKLNHGLTLIHQEISSAAVVSVDIWVNAGATSDPVGAAGMAHFLEHMIFKGTEAIASGEFDLAIETEGGSSRAATSHDYAHYAFTVAANQFPKTLDYLAQMLLNAKIDAEAMEQERLVVLEEWRQANDDPDWVAYQHLMTTAYGAHPYGGSVLGNEESIRNITAVQMRDYHRSHYIPSQMTVAIAGAVDRDAAIEVVNNAFRNNFADRLDHCQEPMATVAATVAITGINRQTMSLPRLSQSRLNLAWVGVGVDSFVEAIQLELLLTVLVEGRSARLVQQLVAERGWVQDIAGSFSLQQAPSLFTIAAYLDAEYLDLVEAHIIEQVQDLRDRPLPLSELNKAKRSLNNNFTFALESPSQLASFLGYHGLLGCESLCRDWSTAYCAIVRNTEAEDLQHLAQKYLSTQNYVVTRLIAEANS
ncbi:insulinase family protein [Pseudanabaena sp. FACHB-1277]|uniref:Insulinase family protein n=1 Tax=Pseudanabaena cinerea FACHB-1277 TaxID=2949581 RepID=A0A926Z5B3_9CYAN|nr:insulinase family protein [Pseudanabaena cinerea FACHB-1277]